MTRRDESMIRHLAGKVMGWQIEYTNSKKRALVSHGDGTYRLLWTNHSDESAMLWRPRDSWADAGMVWERAREIGHEIMMCGVPLEGYMAGQPMSDTPVKADSGPRALCGAVAKATGWVEPGGKPCQK